MTPLPGYARRVARLPEVLERLESQDRPLSIAELATMVGADQEELREDLAVFAGYDTGFYRDTTLTISVVDGVEYVEMLTSSATSEIGVEFLTGEEVATLYRAGRDLLELEPENTELASALETLASTVLPPDEVLDEPAPGVQIVSDLARAVRDQLRVEIEYSSAWRGNFSTRVIEPYALTQTSRGWEVDAGPVLANRRIRTFLVSHIRSHRVLDEHFELPNDHGRLIEQNRLQVKATLVLPPRTDWVVERFAERSEVRRDTGGEKEVDVWVLPPVAERLGLMVLIAGKGATILRPQQFKNAHINIARRLAQRYRGE